MTRIAIPFCAIFMESLRCENYTLIKDSLIVKTIFACVYLNIGKTKSI